jgi:outer membrane autotransporter protein
MDGVYNSLDVLNFTDPTAFRVALVQLSGEINADLTSVSIESSRVFLNMLGQRLRGTSKDGGSSATGDAALGDDGKARIWIDASANDMVIRGDGNTHDFSLNIAAVVARLDYRIDPAVKVGAALGYTRSGFATSGMYGNGSADSYFAALYGSYAAGPLQLTGIAGFSLSDFNANRVIYFPGQQGATTARTRSQAFLSAAELGYRFQPRADTTLSPIAGLQLISLQQSAFSEQGAGPLDLNVAQTNLTSLRSLLGAELTHDISISESTLLQARMRLAWAHDFSGTDRTVDEAFQQLTGTTFQVTGAEPSHDAAVLSVGLATSGPVQFFFRYDGQYSAVQTNHGGSAGLTVRF